MWLRNAGSGVTGTVGVSMKVEGGTGQVGGGAGTGVAQGLG